MTVQDEKGIIIKYTIFLEKTVLFAQKNCHEMMERGERMPIYMSMIGWIALIAFLRYLSYGGRNVPEKTSLFTAVAVFAYIIFWVGMRSGVADTATYIYGFERTKTGFFEIISELFSSESKSPGFNAFNVFFKTYISTDYHWWLMTIAIVTGVLVMMALYKKSENFLLSSYLFMTMLTFFWMLNGMRQFIAVSIIFYFFPLIEQRKMFKFFIVVLLAALIHYTALIMIPIYFIVTAKPWSLQIFVFVIALMVAVVFIEPLMASMESAMSDTAYGGHFAQFEEDDGVNPVRVAVALVPVVISIWKWKKIESMNNVYINILVNMSLVTAGVYLIGVFTSGIMIGRLPIFTEVGNLILIPFLLKNCFEPNEKKFMYPACIVGYFLFFYLLTKELYYVSEITGLIV